MQCPHCLHHFYSAPRDMDLGECGQSAWGVTLEACPNCDDAILHLQQRRRVGAPITTAIYPKATGRPPVSAAVPWRLAEDYEEAARLLADSPKASAALSRR